MNKRDYYIAACKAQNYKRLAWVIACFTVTAESPDEWKKDPYPFRLVRDPIGFQYVDPENPSKLLRLDEKANNEPLFKAKEKVNLGVGDIPNLSSDVESTYGILLFNWVVMVYAFGAKLPYQNSPNPVKASDIEKEILLRAADDLPNREDETDDKIYMHDYLRYTEGMYCLTGYTQIFAWGATKHILLPPPGVVEYRTKLLEEHKDTLDQAATLAIIDEKLIAYDAAYLKGDPGLNFLISKKSKETVRKKLFLTHGADAGLDGNTIKATLIVPSLSEGWDLDKWGSMNDSTRAGSYNRGAETMLGGVSAKELLRSSSNINILAGDCKSTVGTSTLLTDASSKKLVNFSFIENGETVKYDESLHKEKYMGSVLQVRSPMYCQFEKTDYCSVCCGDRLALNPDGASIEIMGYGSAFLLMSLKSMHSNVLALAHMDFKTAIV